MTTDEMTPISKPGTNVYGKFRSCKFFYDKFRRQHEGRKFFDAFALIINCLRPKAAMVKNRVSHNWKKPIHRDTDRLRPNDKAAQARLHHELTPHPATPFCPTLRQPFFISLNLHAPQSPFSPFFCMPLLKKNLHLTPDLPPLILLYTSRSHSQFSILNYLILHSIFNPYTLNDKVSWFRLSGCSLPSPCCSFSK